MRENNLFLQFATYTVCLWCSHQSRNHVMTCQGEGVTNSITLNSPVEELEHHTTILHATIKFQTLAVHGETVWQAAKANGDATLVPQETGLPLAPSRDALSWSIGSYLSSPERLSETSSIDKLTREMTTTCLLFSLGGILSVFCSLFNKLLSHLKDHDFGISCLFGPAHLTK